MSIERDVKIACEVMRHNIDEQATNYVRETFEKLHKLEQVSGCDIDTLISLFAAGYILNSTKITKQWICRTCNGSGYVSLGPGIRGIKRCPECNGLKKF